MKPSPVTRSLALIAFAAAAAARADQGMSGHGPHAGFAVHRMQECLLNLDLPASQLADIQNGLSAGKVTLKADGEALKTAHEKMESDLASGAEKSVLGADALAMDAARTKLKTDTQAIHDQVLAQLSTEQQATFNACATAHNPHHMGGTSPQAPPQ